MIAGNSKTRRLGKRFGLFWGAFFVILVIFIGVFALFKSTDRAQSRVNVAIATSPVSVWSWDSKEGTLTIVTIPSDLVIDTVGGYGKYSLEAAWKLGFIDNRRGEVFAQSLSDALAIPISGYVGFGSNEFTPVDDAVSFGSRFFSYTRIPSMLLGRYHTNLSVPLFFSFLRGIEAATSQRHTVIELSAGQVATSQDLPDGTKRSILDTERIDSVLKGEFEDIRVRREALTVGVYNTTGLPALGNRAARMLGAIGVLVVFVGNDEPEVSTCELLGREDRMKSHTARVIRELFDCAVVVKTEEQTNDLTLRLGTSYAARFEPQEGSAR